MERIFDIANVPFEQVPLEEKKQYEGTMKVTGSYQGYKLREYWVGLCGWTHSFWLLLCLYTAHRWRRPGPD
jgi:hypothetical protein